eukprot:COSAG05_NODE_3324_length_2149_cov_2.369268_3_plen_116_part_00
MRPLLRCWYRTRERRLRAPFLRYFARRRCRLRHRLVSPRNFLMTGDLLLHLHGHACGEVDGDVDVISRSQPLQQLEEQVPDGDDNQEDFAGHRTAAVVSIFQFQFKISIMHMRAK